MALLTVSNPHARFRDLKKPFGILARLGEPIATPWCSRQPMRRHGADAYAPLLDARYAAILAHATDAVVGLLFKTHLGSARRDPLLRFRYGDHPDFDEAIDGDYGPFDVLEVPLIASEALFRTDFGAYRAALVQFKQEASTDAPKAGETEE